MAYDVYLGKMLLPVPPSEIEVSIGNKNQTLTLINDGEVNLLKAPGLTEVRFTALIPQARYPFARYLNGFEGAQSYLDYFEQLKTAVAPFQFIVSRCLPDGRLLFDTNLTVSMERYSIRDSAKNGFDLEVEVALKQYRAYGTRTVEIDVPSETAPVIVNDRRPAPVNPEPAQAPAEEVAASSGSASAAKKKPKQTSGTYSTVKLTVSRGGTVDGGTCALNKYTAAPGESVTVMARAKNLYLGDYFTWNGTKEASKWSFKVPSPCTTGTIDVKVYYRKIGSSPAKTVQSAAKTVQKAASSVASTVTSVIDKIKSWTKKSGTTTTKKAASGSRALSSTAKAKTLATRK